MLEKDQLTHAMMGQGERLAVDEDDAPVRTRVSQGANPIKVWREFRKMSVAQLAEATSLKEVRVKRIEHSISTANQSDLHAVAQATKIHPAQLTSIKGMTPALVELLIGAVQADGDAQRPYALQAMASLKWEADRAGRTMQRELNRLLRHPEQFLAYRAMKLLSELEALNPVDDAMVEDVLKEMRISGEASQKKTKQSLSGAEKEFERSQVPINQDWRLVSDAPFENHVRLLDCWQRSIGRRNFLEGMRLYPAMYGLTPWSGKRTMRGKRVNWRGAVEHFVDAVSHGLTKYEMYVWDYRDNWIAEKQLGYLNIWSKTEPGLIALNQYRNRQMIAKAFPGLVEPLPKKLVVEPFGPRFPLAKAQGPV